MSHHRQGVLVLLAALVFMVFVAFIFAYRQSASFSTGS
jgi:hypothetical protein